MLLGRAPEIAEIEQAFARAREGTADALLLVGPPGIGKTALLDTAWELARDFERVRISGSAPESQLPWAGLSSLLVAWPALAASESGVLRDAIAGSNAPATAIGAALHAAIAQRCGERPVALLIDDVQWLDVASIEAIAFACRRLTSDRVALVAARRPDGENPLAFARERTLPPLARDECHALARARFALPREVEERCVAAAEGNPLALIHLCGSLTPEQRRGLRAVETSEAPPQPIAAAFAARLAELPSATLRALVVLATHSEAAALAGALASMDADASDLLAAEAAGIVRLGAEPRLTHPLWGAAILERAEPALRRRAHAALAAHSRDPDRAALHRAASAEGPSEAIAREVEAHALRCGKRGLPALAARAWADAARLSETEESRTRRQRIAAQMFWDASLPDAALDLLEASLRSLADPAERAAAVLLQHNIRAFTHDARGAALALRDEARRIAGRAPDLELSMHWAATVAALVAADATLGVELAQAALAAARTRDQLAVAEALLGYAAVHLGDGSERHAIERVEAIAHLTADEIHTDPINAMHLCAWTLMVRDRRAECVSVLGGLLAESARRGLVAEQAWASGVLAEVEYRRGRWLDALAHANPDPFGELRADGRDALRHAVGAHVLAQLGDRAGCTARARTVQEIAEARGALALASFARAALGADALAHGEIDGAIAALWPLWELRKRRSIGEAGVIWYQADLVEALVVGGRRGDAREVVRDLAANASATNGRWARAAAARGAALLGEGSAAEAIAAASDLDSPFELARTRLALVERRVCAPRDAVLSAALESFERLGAKPWIARARTQLGASTASPSSLAHVLTEAELRVALLVARGASNGEAAGELTLSVRTVDAHLRTIFRKLGISRRTQLAVRVNQESGAG